jgi:hypothetical protein
MFGHTKCFAVSLSMTARSLQSHRGGESIRLSVATSFSASVIGGGFSEGGTQRLKCS